MTGYIAESTILSLGMVGIFVLGFESRSNSHLSRKREQPRATKRISGTFKTVYMILFLLPSALSVPISGQDVCKELYVRTKESTPQNACKLREGALFKWVKATPILSYKSTNGLDNSTILWLKWQSEPSSHANDSLGRWLMKFHHTGSSRIGNDKTSKPKFKLASELTTDENKLGSWLHFESLKSHKPEVGSGQCVVKFACDPNAYADDFASKKILQAAHDLVTAEERAAKRAIEQAVDAETDSVKDAQNSELPVQQRAKEKSQKLEALKDAALKTAAFIHHVENNRGRRSAYFKQKQNTPRTFVLAAAIFIIILGVFFGINYLTAVSQNASLNDVGNAKRMRSIAEADTEALFTGRTWTAHYGPDDEEEMAELRERAKDPPQSPAGQTRDF